MDYLPVYIILAVLFLLFVWFIANYNALVRLKNYCKEAWSDIDTELKRRYDLIPNLVETVKGYAKHEQEMLERVVAARNRAMAAHRTLHEQARDENALVGELKHLFAVAEGYPDLKASHNFLHLQKELANTEDRIQAARRFYNANVRDLNTRIEVFPSNLIASLFGFTKEEFYEVEDVGIRQPPGVKV
jgi:LemA protein